MENKKKRLRRSRPEERREFKGRNLEDAISHAEHVLKMPREEFNYEIVTEKTKLFGIKSKEIVIRAWPKKASRGERGRRFPGAPHAGLPPRARLSRSSGGTT